MDSDFEQRLRRQPVKQIPAELRAEILTAARAARETQPIRHSSFVIRPSLLSTISHQLSTLLWPHPKAWAGLAAVWVAILALNLSMHETATPALAKRSSPPSAEMTAELSQQHKLYAELIGAAESRDADRRPFFLPKPRSERVEISAA
jgi:hypothetical protein